MVNGYSIQPTHSDDVLLFQENDAIFASNPSDAVKRLSDFILINPQNLLLLAHASKTSGLHP